MTTHVDYDAISATYDGFRGVSSELADTILAEARLFPGARLLDIGCGTGNIEAALAGIADIKPVGVDRSFGMLRTAHAKIPHIMWIQADSGALPLRHDAFDCVLMLYLLHHLNDCTSTIANAYSLLREGRLVVMTSSHKQIEESFACRFFPSYASVDKTRFPKIRTIIEAMQEAGFHDVSSRPITVANVTLDDNYIKKVENRHVSTYRLISEEEFQQGLARMRRFIDEHRGEPPMDHRGTLIAGTKSRQ